MRRLLLAAVLGGVALVAGGCWIVPKAESVKLRFDNRTDSLLCSNLSEKLAAAESAAGGCVDEIEPMATTSWEPGCGYGAGAERLPLTVILTVAAGGRRIYDRTAECRVWEDSDRTFIIEKDGDEFVVTEPGGLDVEP